MHNSLNGLILQRLNQVKNSPKLSNIQISNINVKLETKALNLATQNRNCEDVKVYSKVKNIVEDMSLTSVEYEKLITKVVNILNV